MGSGHVDAGQEAALASVWPPHALIGLYGLRSLQRVAA
jgi:hypothetical protein